MTRMIQGVWLGLYVHENTRLHGKLSYEWLLEEARRLGIQGGSVFRAIAGFGRHGVLHEDRFFELAGDLPIVVEFILTASQADEFLARVRQEKLAVFYRRLAVDFGVTDGTDV